MMMDDMLDIEAIAALEPISSLAPARIYELLDYCRMESIASGQDPFKMQGLKGQSLYLVEGELELLFQDKNRLKISAGSEWAKHPLGNHQPAIAGATALGNVRLMCVNKELVEIMAERNWRLSQEDAGQTVGRQAVGGHPAGNGRLLSSGMDSLEYFKTWPFMQLPPENLGKLIQLIEVVAVWDNDTIIREGEEGDYYYMLEKGCAEVYRVVGGVNMVLAKLKPGDAFGEEALISGAKRNATVTM